MSTLSNTYNLLLSPSSVSLFARHLLPFGRRLFCRRFLCHLDLLPNYRSQPCLILAPNHAPVAADSTAGRRACAARPRGKAGSERRKACFHPGGSGFLLPRDTKQQCRLPVLSAWLSRRTQPSLVLSLYAPRYCLTASAGFGRQFAKLRALSRLRRRYDSRKKRNPRPPAFPTSSPAPDRPRCSAGTHPPACPRRESGASVAFAARKAG